MRCDLALLGARGACDLDSESSLALPLCRLQPLNDPTTHVRPAGSAPAQDWAGGFSPIPNLETAYGLWGSLTPGELAAQAQACARCTGLTMPPTAAEAAAALRRDPGGGPPTPAGPPRDEDLFVPPVAAADLPPLPVPQAPSSADCKACRSSPGPYQPYLHHYFAHHYGAWYSEYYAQYYSKVGRRRCCVGERESRSIASLRAVRQHDRRSGGEGDEEGREETPRRRDEVAAVDALWARKGAPRVPLLKWKACGTGASVVVKLEGTPRVLLLKGRGSTAVAPLAVLLLSLMGPACQ